MDRIAETPVLTSIWDLSTYSFKLDVEGLTLLMKGLKEKKFLGRKCDTCGTVYVPGPNYCRKCVKEISHIVEAGQEGTIGAFTVALADIRGNPLPVPGITACVMLDGSHTYLMSKLEGWTDWKSVKSGQRVRVQWVDNPQGAMADISCFKTI